MTKRFMTNEVGCIVDYKDNLKNYDGEEIVDLLNQLADENKQLKQEVENLKDVNAQCCNDYSHYRRENEQLKQELKVYRKIASCSNCHYHDYDTLFGGDDEYEICEKGNDVTDGICNEWRES